MARFGKICGCILLSIVPLIFIIGLSRVLLQGKETFLPSSNELVNAFLTMPDFALQFRLSLDSTRNALKVLYFNLQPINNLADFFNLFGSFFNSIGTALYQFFQQLIICINSIIWFFGFLFGF